MTEFLIFFGKITYVTLIISSVIFGISIAVDLWINVTIKNINKETDFNFGKIKDEETKNLVISKIDNANTKFVDFLKESKKIDKQKTRNKIRKFFKLKEKKVDKTTLNAKDILIELAKGVYEPFSNVNGVNRGYLSFTEEEIFTTLKLLIERVEKIFNSSNVIWLKTLKVSTLLQIYNVRGAIKNNLFITVSLSLINFFMWFGRVFSPVSISKYFLKTINSQNLSGLISYSVVNILGKELAVLYKENRLKSESLTKENKIA